MALILQTPQNLELTMEMKESLYSLQALFHTAMMVALQIMHQVEHNGIL